MFEDDISRLREISEFVLKQARHQGADEAEVSIESEDGLSAAVRLGELDTLEFHQSKDVSVAVFFGKRRAHASTSDLSESALISTVKAACEIAKLIEEDPCNGLADAALMDKNYPDVEQYFLWDLGSQKAIELALACERAALGYDKRIVNSDGVSVNTHAAHYVYANTAGFIGDFSETRHSLNCSLVAEEGKDMQRGYAYTTSCEQDKLLSTDKVALLAAQRTVSRLHGKKIKTQKAPVIFDAEVSSHLVSTFAAAISGGNLYRRSSFLLDHLKQPVFPAFIDISEDPHQKRTLGAVPFDEEGVLTRKKHFIHAGILESYILSSYSARRLGMQTTANSGGIFNVSMTASDSGRQEENLKALLKRMGKGLLVTSLMGSSVNITTGDYSRGAEGFWVENGEIQYPVQEVTIASNLKDMFMNIEAIAKDVNLQRNIKTGSVLVAEMTLAGE